jgi:hypothetical protein
MGKSDNQIFTIIIDVITIVKLKLVGHVLESHQCAKRYVGMVWTIIHTLMNAMTAIQSRAMVVHQHALLKQVTHVAAAQPNIKIPVLVNVVTEKS